MQWGTRQSQFIDQPITKGCCQPYGSHVSDPTDSLTATRLGLCSSLVPSNDNLASTCALCKLCNSSGNDKGIQYKEIRYFELPVGQLKTVFAQIQWVNSSPAGYVWLFSTLTHWGRDKMDAISQTTFWSAFSWMKMFEFRLKFHWSLFLRVQLTIFQHWFR